MTTLPGSTTGRVLLGTFVTVEGVQITVGEIIQGILDAHSNDLTAHGLAAVREELGIQGAVLKYAHLTSLSWDEFGRAPGAIGSTPQGQAWGGLIGASVPTINNGAAVAVAGGPSIAALTIPGHDYGLTVAQITGTNIVGGDLWLYAWFEEATPAGVVLQRGSDRVRVGLQVGGAITWVQEALIGAQAGQERISLILDGPANTASVQLNGAQLITDAVIPPFQRGAKIGFRLGSDATADHWRLLRREVL
jgi:hypothetical protein